jgi:beta-galactosidase
MTTFRIFAFLLVMGFIGAMNGQTRTIIDLENWKFHKGEVSEAWQPEFDDSNWQNVRIPHDWAIYGPFDKEIDKQVVAIVQNGEEVATEKTGRTGALPFTGEGWYRTSINVPGNLTDKRVLIAFDGAMSEPVIWLNGQKVGEWGYGYSYFYFDITKYLDREEENVLAVRLRNLERSSRWYPGAGLYRKVRVIVKNTESIDQWGTFVTTPFISEERAKVRVQTKATGTVLALVTKLYDENGVLVGKDSTVHRYGKEFDQLIPVDEPQLWSPEQPYRYTAISELYAQGVLKDRVKTRFGIRSVTVDAENGFQLNGKTMKLKGVCLHHDLGPLGTAVNKAALRRQLKILKDMGCNAVRSAHNMPSIEQLELCDEMGIMFLAESFDEWAKPKVENGYNRFFEEYAEKDVVNLVRATRNHPSIIMWSSGNEVPDQWGADGVKRARWLQEIFKREDPTRPVTVGMDQVKATLASGFAALMDVPGLNYRVHLYQEAYETLPQGFILGSETASTVSSRGIYKFPPTKGQMVKHDDLQCSSYDLEYCSW